MYLFSPTELAPTEDQGVVFGAIDVPPNATLEQLTPYTEAGQPASSQSTPEFDHSFQITFPTGGFGGMLVKPWGERKRSIFPIQQELAPKLARIPGVRAPAFLPPALPSAGHLPGRVRHRLDGEPRGADPASPSKLVQEAMKSGQFAFPPHHRRAHRSGEDARS